MGARVRLHRLLGTLPVDHRRPALRLGAAPVYARATCCPVSVCAGSVPAPPLSLSPWVVATATAVPAAPPAWPDENPSVDADVRHSFVWIPAGDHRIPGILALPKAGGAARSYPAVVMLHGFASHKDEVGDMYLREARALAEPGIASLRIDFAGTGDSEQPYTANTWTGMVADAVTAHDWLVAHPRIVDDRVGVLGFSMGSKVGLGLLAERSDVSAFASWSGALYDGIPPGFIDLYDEAQANGSVVLDLGFAVVELSLAWFDTMIASTPVTDATGYLGQGRYSPSPGRRTPPLTRRCHRASSPPSTPSTRRCGSSTAPTASTTS